MLDRERILAKLDELEGYLNELHQIAPANFEQYQRSTEKRRACERLLQISIEAILDTCGLVVVGLRLGLPSEEDDLFEKLEQAGLISNAMKQRLRTTKGFRNLLVHEYGRVDDRIVFEILHTKLTDFQAFKKAILRILSKESL